MQQQPTTSSGADNPNAAADIPSFTQLFNDVHDSGKDKDVNYGEYEEGIYERLEDLVIPEMDSEEGVSSSSSDETFENDGFQGWDQRNKGWDCIGTRTDTTSHYCFPVSTGSADSQYPTISPIFSECTCIEDDQSSTSSAEDNKARQSKSADVGRKQWTHQQLRRTKSCEDLPNKAWNTAADDFVVRDNVKLIKKAAKPMSVSSSLMTRWTTTLASTATSSSYRDYNNNSLKSFMAPPSLPNVFEMQRELRRCAMRAHNFDSFYRLIGRSPVFNCAKSLLDELFFDYRLMALQRECMDRNDTDSTTSRSTDSDERCWTRGRAVSC